MHKPNFAIASLSLGTNAHHDLPTKIKVAAQLGYQGIEIFIDDFSTFIDQALDGKHADLFPSTFHTASSSSAEIDIICAKAVADLCSAYGLQIPCLQPLRNFENFSSSQDIDKAVDEIERWLALMPAMNTDLLLVCSNNVPGPHPIRNPGTEKSASTGSFSSLEEYLDTQVVAFTRLGERAAKYGVRLGYEPLAWGTVVHRWEYVWDVVKRVDMDNVGIILDSFNTLGRQYADPSTDSSLLPASARAELADSLSSLASSIPGHKIFLYQLADAERPAHTVSDEFDESTSERKPARMKWSRACRVFPCEPAPATLKLVEEDEYTYRTGPATLGFLPVPYMTSFVMQTGYNGWWSLEVFNASLADADVECPKRHGERGIKGLEALWNLVSNEEEDALTKSDSSESSGESDEVRSEGSSSVTSEENTPKDVVVGKMKPSGLNSFLKCAVL